MNKGMLIVVSGPSGCGKSTVLRMIAGLVKPDSGEVWLGGNDITALTPGARGVGMVFQDPDDQLFMPRLDEDVAFGPANMGLSQKEVDERVQWALKCVGLSDQAAKVPHHLSFGQRKRAAFATVLSMRPPVLVLDEPTSNLDPRSRMEMVSLIREQQRNGTAIITATHDVNLVPLLADRVLLLNKNIVAEGDVHQIMSRRDLMDDLGLEMPILADLFETLQEEGLYSGAIPFKKGEAIGTIREMLHR